jgi:hypothetical protein
MTKFSFVSKEIPIGDLVVYIEKDVYMNMKALQKGGLNLN